MFELIIISTIVLGLIVILLLIVWLIREVSKQSRRSNYLRRRNTKLKTENIVIVVLIVLICFFYIASIRSFTSSQKTEFPLLDARQVQDASAVPVTFRNASPHRLRLILTISEVEKYETLIDPCPSCIVYPSKALAPKVCPQETINKTFILLPGTYQVEVHFLSDRLRSHTSTIIVSNAKNQSQCWRAIMGYNIEQ